MKSDSKPKAKDELAESKESNEATMLELEQLSNNNAQLNQICHFVMQNSELRQTARDDEVEALKLSKAILSGVNFEEFMQTA